MLFASFSTSLHFFCKTGNFSFVSRNFSLEEITDKPKEFTAAMQSDTDSQMLLLQSYQVNQSEGADRPCV